jgi:hypothetical protein
MEDNMQLSDLVGEHILDAVDFEVEKIDDYRGYLKDCNVMRFRLDGVVYVAVEDPEDGYRSCMRDLKMADPESMRNVFQPVKVLARHRTIGSYGDQDDVLELVDVENWKVILEAGTEALGDYYPGFVARFTPEDMSTNQ